MWIFSGGGGRVLARMLLLQVSELLGRFVMGHWVTTWGCRIPLYEPTMFHHFQLTAYCAPAILHGFENHSKTLQTLQHCAQVASQ